MGQVRVGFGRYELGSKDGDMKLVQYLHKLEKSTGSATEAFRQMAQRDMDREEKEEAK